MYEVARLLSIYRAATDLLSNLWERMKDLSVGANYSLHLTLVAAVRSRIDILETVATKMERSERKKKGGMFLTFFFLSRTSLGWLAGCLHAPGFPMQLTANSILAGFLFFFFIIPSFFSAFLAERGFG